MAARARDQAGGRASLASAALFLYVLALCWPGLRSPWVDNESFNVVLSRPSFADLGSLKHLFSSRYFETFGEGGYRPLTSLGYFLTRLGFGAEPSPFKFLKFGLHFANALWVYAIGVRLMDDRLKAALAAFIHFSCLVQPVFMGMAFLPDLLSAFFSLLALWLHITSDGRAFSWRNAGVLAAWGCAVAAKELSLFLPMVLLAYDLIWRRLAIRDVWRGHIVSWLCCGFYLAYLRLWINAESFYGSIGAVGLTAFWSLPARLAGYAAIFYSMLGAWSLAALVVPSAWGWWLHGRQPQDARLAGFIVSWVFFALLPVLGLLPFPRFADYFANLEPRYLELAGAALCYPLVAWLPIDRLGAPWRGALVLGAALSCSSALRGTAVDWVDRPLRADLSAASTESKPVGHTAAGSLLLSLPFLRLLDDPLHREALRRLETELSPERARWLVSYFDQDSIRKDPEVGARANIFLAQMDWTQLMAFVDRSVRLGLFPGEHQRARSHYDAAIACFNSGDWHCAIRRFDLSVAADPTYLEAYLSRGAIWGQQKQWAKAIADYDRAMSLQPRDPSLRRAILESRASTLEMVGRHPLAQRDLREAASLK